jgi:hypothetical protein
MDAFGACDTLSMTSGSMVAHFPSLAIRMGPPFFRVLSFAASVVGEPTYVNAYSGEVMVVAIAVDFEVAVALELAREDRRCGGDGLRLLDDSTVCLEEMRIHETFFSRFQTRS